MTDADRIAALEAALADVLKRLDPQTLKQALERTWDPRGGEPRVVDEDGLTLDYAPSIQFLNATTELDVPAQRVVVTPTGGSGGHIITDGDTFLPMPTQPNLLIVSGDNATLDIAYVDSAPYTGLLLTVPDFSFDAVDVQVFDGSVLGPGTYSWTEPPDGTVVAVNVLTIGAGGGGGGPTAAGAGATGGGGGGGGAYSRVEVFAPGTSFDVYLGTPGTGGGIGVAGGDATPTFADLNGLGFPLSGTPAMGGTAGAVGTPGVGGAGEACPIGHGGGAGGDGADEAGPTAGTPGGDGSGGSAGGGAGGAILGQFGGALLGGAARTANNLGGTYGTAVWSGGEGGASDIPASGDLGGWPWGGGGEGGCSSAAAGTVDGGDGGPALVVVITHLVP